MKPKKLNKSGLNKNPKFLKKSLFLSTLAQTNYLNKLLHWWMQWRS